MQGITVILYEKTSSGTDAFNAPVFTETPVKVKNVLVAPATSADVINDLQLYGKTLAYDLYIPKGDTHTWNDCKVEFFGATWHCYTYPEEWVNGLVPNAWNKRVKVERYG